ncbi:Hypothetical protein, putative [Bodo saltans]|uniref:Uncharacterized protein n=1 Tax=Bodo saltans TaxID=75058 RepID=A0A0S4J9S6_BODSA|nr:Hypothetical protein, putative [Bodo saltans]|eukprot:CUG87240.1 Hypothetical protein, putative [Bodo saltans]
MWHELYAPSSVADCTWSRQKVTELTNIIYRFWGGGEDGAVLVYGPSGCGKTSAIAPIVKSIEPHVVLRCHSMAPDVPTVKGVEDLQRFLASRYDSSSEGQQSIIGEHRLLAPESTNEDSKKRPLCIQLVKLLCFGDSYHTNGGGGGGNGTSVSHAMLRFLQQLQQQQRSNNNNASSCSLEPVTITFFLHTTHDSHSDKVNLNQYFGDAVVNHPYLIKFHCTAATVRALKSRLASVLTTVRAKEAAADSKRMSRIALSSAELDRIASCANGDIRQAMLQLQFMSIDPNPTSIGGASSQDRQHQRRGATIVVDADATDDDNDEAERLFGGASSQRPPAKPSKSTKARAAAAAAAAKPQASSSQRSHPRGSLNTSSSTIEDLLNLNDAQSASNSSLSPLDHVASAAKNGSNSSTHIKATVGVRDDYIDVAHASARLLTQKYDVVDVLRVLTVPPERLLGYMTNNMFHYFESYQLGEYAECCALVSALESFSTPQECAEHGGGIGVIGGDDQTGGGGGGGNIRRVKLQPQEQEVLSRMGLHVLHRGYCTLHKNVFIPKVLLSQKPPPFMPPCFPRVSSEGNQATNKWRRNKWRGPPEKRSRFTMENGEDLAWCLPADEDDAAVVGGGGPSTRTFTDVERLRSEWAERILAICPTTSAKTGHGSDMMHASSSNHHHINTIVDALRGMFMPEDRNCCSVNDVMLDVMPLLPKIVFDVRRFHSNPAMAHHHSKGSWEVVNSCAAGRQELPIAFNSAAAASPVASNTLARPPGVGVKRTMMNFNKPITQSPPPQSSQPPVATAANNNIAPMRRRLNVREAEVLSAAYSVLVLSTRRPAVTTPSIFPEFLSGSVCADGCSPTTDDLLADDPIEDA